MSVAPAMNSTTLNIPDLGDDLVIACQLPQEVMQWFKNADPNNLINYAIKGINNETKWQNPPHEFTEYSPILERGFYFYKKLGSTKFYTDASPSYALIYTQNDLLSLLVDGYKKANESLNQDDIDKLAEMITDLPLVDAVSAYTTGIEIDREGKLKLPEYNSNGNGFFKGIGNGLKWIGDHVIKPPLKFLGRKKLPTAIIAIIAGLIGWKTGAFGKISDGIQNLKKGITINRLQSHKVPPKVAKIFAEAKVTENKIKF